MSYYIGIVVNNRKLTVSINPAQKLLSEAHRIEGGDNFDIFARVELYVRQIFRGKGSFKRNLRHL